MKKKKQIPNQEDHQNHLKWSLTLCVTFFNSKIYFQKKKKKLMVLTTKAADCIQIKHLTENKNKLYFLLFHRWFDTFSCFYWRLFFLFMFPIQKVPEWCFIYYFIYHPFFFCEVDSSWLRTIFSEIA